MRPLLGLAVVVLLFVSVGEATAEYGAGSRLEVDAPALLDGRADALVSRGLASFVATGTHQSLDASLTAQELQLRFQTVVVCERASTPLGSGCPAAATRAEPILLSDALVSVTRILEPYTLAVTNNETYADTSSFGAPGTMVVSTGGSSYLGAYAQARHLSAYHDGWSQTAPRAHTDDVYTIDPFTPHVSATGGSLRALGGFESFYQGLELRVTGTTSDGRPFEATYRTDTQRAGNDVTYNFVVVEASGAELHARSAASVTAFGVRLVDVPRDSVTFSGASGTVVQDGVRTQHDGAMLTLPGPLELTILQVLPGEAARLSLAVSSNLRVIASQESPENEPRTAGELVAAGAAGAGGGALIAGLVYFWPRLRYATTLLAVPLYTRIGRTEVLEHDKRDEIYELIRSSPGIHAHEIGSKAGIGWGTTVYHLKLLEEHSLVVSKRAGRYKRFFVNTGEFTKKKDVYGALRNETAKAVADFIVNHPGTSQKELCQALGIQPSLASWHVGKLEQVDLVKRVKDGRQVRYFAGAAWSDLNVRIDPAGGAQSVAET